MNNWELEPMSARPATLNAGASRETLNLTTHAGHGRAFYLRNPREHVRCCARRPAPRAPLYVRAMRALLGIKQ